MLKECLDCKKQFPYESFQENGKASNGKKRKKPRCRECMTIYQHNYFYNNVVKAVGSKEKVKCACCNYNKCFAALEFHHIDPLSKDFELSKMRTRSYAVIKTEIDKCVLLCAICHREYHAGLPVMWV